MLFRSFILHRPDPDFGGFHRWGQQDHDEAWYGRMRGDPRAASILGRFVREVLPVDRDVRRITRDSLAHFTAMGADVVDAEPDFGSAYEAFQILRAHLVATMHASTLERHRDLIKPDIVWNIEKGLAQTVADVQWAERARGALVHRMTDFFDDHDVLVVPSAPLPPFPVEWTSPREIDGTELTTYIDWIAITFCISLTGCPVVALPSGLDRDGLPIGVQLVGRPGSEARLLSYAQRFEQGVGIADRIPVTPRGDGAVR